MENRVLGRTGIRASVYAFGGIVTKDTTAKESSDAVARAVDAGVNYFDVAPSYGNAQDMLGPALEPYRNRVTLACKTAVRDGAGARRELEHSLKTLRTDHFDVYQIHGLATMEDVEQVIAPGGALETIVDAKKEGLVRFIGFSSHNDAASMRVMDAFDFDSILTPVNWASWLKNGFARDVIARAKDRDMARLALKAQAYGPKNGDDGYERCWYHPIADDPRLAELALRFTLTRDVHLAICPGDVRLFDLGLSILKKHGGTLPPLNGEELGELTTRAKRMEEALFE